jgi:hypothetical protein
MNNEIQTIPLLNLSFEIDEQRKAEGVLSDFMIMGHDYEINQNRIMIYRLRKKDENYEKYYKYTFRANFLKGSFEHYYWDYNQWTLPCLYS